MVDIKLLQSLNDVFTNVMKQIFLTPVSSCDPEQNDITWTQRKILVFLEEHGAQKMSTIARQICVTMSAATAIVEKMVRAELVVREADPTDRRVIRIDLSQKGKQLLAESMKVQARCFEEILERLEPAKRAELVGAFEQIHRLLSEVQSQASPYLTPTGTDLSAAVIAHAAANGK
jgi:DNA-binding MarR family transcriptional regulator